MNSFKGGWFVGRNPDLSWRGPISYFVTACSLSLTLLFSLSISGCLSGIKLRVGSRPNTDFVVSRLSFGKSTQAEVQAILGVPFARGRAFFPNDPRQQVKMMWTYYYGEGTIEDLRQMFLYVYFDEDLYDGYMWFSSLPSQR